MEDRNYIEYRYRVESLFFRFLKEKDLDFLIKNLYEVEDLIKDSFDNPNDMGLWFRFFDQDILATTIGNINSDLSMPENHPNHELMIEMFEMAIDLNGEIRIYFS